MAEGEQRLLTPDDDNFHTPTDDWWFHETCWFWFYVPERALGGWLYNWIRPTIGVTGGGCWVWDDSTALHWEVPYYSNHHNLRLPEQRDLRDFKFPSGVHVVAQEPLQRYSLSYRDEGSIALDLEFDAVMEPWVTTADDGHGVLRPRHLDQVGRVRGTVVLDDEHLAVDCLAIRDRTWGLRSERWRTGGGYGYTNAMAESGEAFLAVGDHQSIHGYLTLNGTRQELIEGTRSVERDPSHGHPTRVIISGRDADGRELEAVGNSVSRMAMPIPGVHGMVWTSLVEWTVNGVAAWGEDQEPWPIARWSARRRADHRR